VSRASHTRDGDGRRRSRPAASGQRCRAALIHDGSSTMTQPPTPRKKALEAFDTSPRRRRRKGSAPDRSRSAATPRRLTSPDDASAHGPRPRGVYLYVEPDWSSRPGDPRVGRGARGQPADQRRERRRFR
jgi:hypothetical protein